MKNIFFNPFEKFSHYKLLFIGIIANLIGISLFFQFKLTNIGFLKLDFVSEISIRTVIVQALSITISIALVLFGLGKIINVKTRFIDILNTVLIAKTPFYTLAIFNVNDAVFIAYEKLKAIIFSQNLNTISNLDFPIILIFSFTSIICLIWSIILLYNGFKTATNLKETKHKVFFGIAIIIADIISRIIISNLT